MDRLLHNAVPRDGGKSQIRMEFGGPLLDRGVFGISQTMDTCGRLRGGMGYSSDVCRRYVLVSLTLFEHAIDDVL